MIFFFIKLICVVLSTQVKKLLGKKKMLVEFYDSSYLKRSVTVSISPQAKDFSRFK